MTLKHFYKSIGEDWFTFPNLYKSMVVCAKEGAHFVEIGSWKGRSSVFMGVEIINSGKNIRFDCIDTWKKTPTDDKLNRLIETGGKEDWLYEEFLKNIKPVKKVINPIRTTSVEAANLYTDKILDFVFIDACHDYDNVFNDITAWFPKVKIGGVIAGHDYDHYTAHRGLRRAVDEFFEGKDVKLSERCWIFHNEA